MRTVAFCEVDTYCRSVLRRHWPRVPIYRDVAETTGERLRADGISVDLVAGGFPCQDLSVAGSGAGLAGARSGLWAEFARILGEVRPRFAIVENVPGLISRDDGRWFGRVLGDLAALGFDAEWHCIPASAIGAPHRRDRVWIIAYPLRDRPRQPLQSIAVAGRGVAADSRRHGSLRDVSDADRGGCEEQRLAEPSGEQSERRRVADRLRPDGRLDDAAADTDADGEGLSPSKRGPVLSARAWNAGRAASQLHWWTAESDVGRMAHGVPGRVDRLRALGNAVVPQIPEIIGRAIIASEARP